MHTALETSGAGNHQQNLLSQQKRKTRLMADKRKGFHKQDAYTHALSMENVESDGNVVVIVICFRGTRDHA